MPYLKVSPKRKAPRLSSKGWVLPIELWRDYVMMYADLPTLLVVHRTHPRLRDILDDPGYVREWCEGSWLYLERGCPCARNLFLLDVEEICPFFQDVQGCYSLRDVDVFLRTLGRSVPMYLDPVRTLQRVKRVDPRRLDVFAEGVLTIHLTGLLVPAPRMTHVPVENTRPSHFPVRQWLDTAGPEESEEQFAQRCYWRGVHQVPEPVKDPNPKKDGEPAMEPTTTPTLRVILPGVVRVRGSPVGLPPTAEETERMHTGCFPYDPVTGFLTLSTPWLDKHGRHPTRDPVEAYVRDVTERGGDPYDPMEVDDDEARGYRTVEQARDLIRSTAVGCQTYPYELCLRRSQLVGRASRLGVDYIDHLFLPLEHHTAPHAVPIPDRMVFGHSGTLHLSPVRYENERGDFVPWCLSTLALIAGVRRYLWYDAVHYVLRHAEQLVHQLITETENSFGIRSLSRRLRFLDVNAVGSFQAVWPNLQDMLNVTQYERRLIASTSDRNDAAHRLLHQHMFADYVEILRERVRAFDAGLQYPPAGQPVGYLQTLWTHHERLTRMGLVPMTDDHLVYRLRETMRVAEFLVGFSQHVASPQDRLTTQRHSTLLRTYLGTSASLLCFAPGWERCGEWVPSRVAENAGARIPRINLRHNRRCQLYMEFLRRRENYYRSEPCFDPAQDGLYGPYFVGHQPPPFAGE